ncbi:MAG: glycosyltransferase family 4 protein [Candidatus Omnitrophica bacterium]|nr:glycosyltransferase family 4 protein [Candidatus Omnitrophota bacterium]
MKILLCSLYRPSGQDGVSNSTRQLVSALKVTGVDITVYTTNWGWAKEEMVNQQSAKLKIFKALLNNNFDCSLKMIRHFYKTCSNYDLVHFNSIYSLSTVLGAYFCRKYKIPYIVCPQGNFIPSSVDNYRGIRSVGKKLWFFKIFSRKALLHADKVVCNSELEMKMLCNHIGADNIASINNGLDVEPYRLGVDEGIIKEELGIEGGKPIFLFLGRLAEEKAIPFLLDVWGYVTKKMPQAVLVIGGSSEHGSFEKIKRRVQHLANPETILLPGVIRGDLKKALLRKSKCVLLPSYFESFGIIVLEALISGTPVIASTGTPWKGLEENHFGKWLPWDIKAWGEAMLDISVDKSYHDENFSKRSKQWVNENFNWQNIADKYSNLYEEIAKKREKNDAI